MRKAISGVFGLCIALAIIQSLAIASETEWPTFRHDGGHTGRSLAAGDITDPSLVLRYYLGGRYKPYSVWFGDADGDQHKDIVMALGGAAVARTPDNLIMWYSPNLGFSKILGAWDFDGDGRREVMAIRDNLPAAVYLLNGETGQPVWCFEDFEDTDTQTVGAEIPAYQIQVVDLDADRNPDLLIKPNNAYRYTHVFSFADGYDHENGVTNELWRFRHEHYANSTPYLVGDVDNDGTIEIVFLEREWLMILNVEDGSIQEKVETLMIDHSFGPMFLANVDEDPQSEILMIGMGTGYNQSVTVYDAALHEVQWQLQFDPAVSRLATVENCLVDLDNNGEKEVVVSVFNDAESERTTSASEPGEHDGVNAPNIWTTLVLDAASGGLITRLEHAHVRAIVDIDGDNTAEVFLQRTIAGQSNPSPFGSINSYKFSDNTFIEGWMLDDAAIGNYPVITKADRNLYDLGIVPAAQDLDDDGKTELFVFMDMNRDNWPDRLNALNAEVEPPTVASSFELEGGSSRIVVLGNELSDPGVMHQTVVFQSTGNIEILDNSLSLVRSFRLGGFTSSPLVADLENDGEAEMLVFTSDNYLKVLTLGNDGLPLQTSEKWSRRSPMPPYLTTVDIESDGTLEIPIIGNTDASNPEIQLLNHDGSERWSKVLTGFGSMPYQWRFGHFNDDAALDMLIEARDKQQLPEVDLRLIALDGLTGEEIWNVPAANNNTIARRPIHIFDVDNDGLDDVIAARSFEFEYYDGENGDLMQAVSGVWWTTSNLLADFDDDNTPELLMLNNRPELGIQLYELLSDSPSWTIPITYSGEVDLRWFGVFGLEDGLGFIKPNGYGELMAYGPDGQPFWDAPVYPADGLINDTAPESAIDIPAVTISDIDGTAGEDALIPASDGWLYAMRISDTQPLWSFELNYGLADPIVGDVDNDGTVEILVSSADGYLDIIDQASIAPPTAVRDVAVLNGQIVDPQTDIDTTEYRSQVGAAWDADDTAAGFSISLVDEAGGVIVPWTYNSSNRQVVLDVRLVIGMRYVFRVMAHSADGKNSIPATSDGFIISDESPPTIDRLEITPSVFNPRLTQTSFKAEFHDPTALASWRIGIQNAEGNEVLAFAEEIFAIGYAVDHAWDGQIDDTIAPDGLYLATLRVTDRSGRATTAEANFSIDTVAPKSPDLMEPEENALLNTSTPEISGAAEALSLVSVKQGGMEICSVTTNEAGNWSCIPETALSEGEHQVSATATDQAGNESALSDVRSFATDTIIPDAPIINEPEDGAVLATATPTVSGIAEPLTAVSVYLSIGMPYCEVEADELGRFACQPMNPLQNGDYFITANATDPAGNISSSSERRGFSVEAEETDGDLVGDGDSDTESDTQIIDGLSPDTGGCDCNQTPSSSAIYWLIFGLWLGLRRRSGVRFRV